MVSKHTFSLRYHLRKKERVISWWQLACKEEWTPLSVTKLSWSIKIRSVQEKDWVRICVGSVISWWTPWDEETDSRSIPSLVEISPSHQKFDLQLKFPNISIKTRLLKLVSVITWSKLDKKFLRSSGDYEL